MAIGIAEPPVCTGGNDDQEPRDLRLTVADLSQLPVQYVWDAYTALTKTTEGSQTPILPEDIGYSIPLSHINASRLKAIETHACGTYETPDKRLRALWNQDKEQPVIFHLTWYIYLRSGDIISIYSKTDWQEVRFFAVEINSRPPSTRDASDQKVLKLGLIQANLSIMQDQTT